MKLSQKRRCEIFIQLALRVQDSCVEKVYFYFLSRYWNIWRGSFLHLNVIEIPAPYWNWIVSWYCFHLRGLDAHDKVLHWRPQILAADQLVRPIFRFAGSKLGTNHLFYQLWWKEKTLSSQWGTLDQLLCLIYPHRALKMIWGSCPIAEQIGHTSK